LAMPRPKALKRVLAAVASLGVDELVLVNASRVEKSYFDSKVLTEAFIADKLALGLEQAKDTVPPHVLLRERFRPFVEDELSATFGEGHRLVLHPGVDRPLEAETLPPGRVVVAVGPEGGWV